MFLGSFYWNNYLLTMLLACLGLKYSFNREIGSFYDFSEVNSLKFKLKEFKAGTQ